MADEGGVRAAPGLGRRLAWLGGGLAAALLVGMVVVVLVSRTDAGRQRVLDFTLGLLGRSISGELRAERVDGNLLAGAMVYGLAIDDPDGAPFLRADSAFLDYDLLTLVTPRIAIDEAVLWNAQVWIEKLPGDSLWNYQRVFASPDPDRPPSEGPERVTTLDRVRIANGTARVRIAWEPSPRLSPGARRREVAAALTDTGRVVVDSVAGGFAQTWRFEEVRGGFSAIRFAPGTRVGTYLRIDSLSAEAYVFRDPLEVRRAEGELALVGDTVRFRVPRAVLPDSRLSTFGTIRFVEGEEDPRYDVTFDGERVDFADMRWLYPRFPEDAEGTLRLLMETRPGEGLLFLARDARVRAPGTVLSGSFGMLVGDTLRFFDVDLEADPLRVETVEEMLPDSLPVRGLHIGGAELRGSGA